MDVRADTVTLEVVPSTRPGTGRRTGFANRKVMSVVLGTIAS